MRDTEKLRRKEIKKQRGRDRQKERQRHAQPQNLIAGECGN